MPRDIPQEPPQTKEKRVTLQEPWPLPAVVVAYHVTKDGNPDSYPLHIAAKVLSDGQTSRIYKKLVYEKQMAVAAFGNANLIEDPNLFYAVAIVQPGHTPDEVADALIAELDRLKAEPITEHELQRDEEPVRARLHPRPRIESAEGRQLAHAVVIHNDIKTADGEFDIFQNITVADVQRVARTYFTAGEPPGADADAVGQGGCAVTRRSMVDRALALRPVRRAVLGLASVPRCVSAVAASWPTERPPRPLAARDDQVSALRNPDAAQRPAGRRGAAPRAAGGDDAAAGARRHVVRSEGQARAGAPGRVAARSGHRRRCRREEMNDADRLHRRRDGRRRRHRPDLRATWS